MLPNAVTESNPDELDEVTSRTPYDNELLREDDDDGDGDNENCIKPS
ncbi:unnamed protein product [Echinostoma caproni]|uniref:Uncharacterized protein n=1 Tax=Echinostoma caproni TaxID=27848 RepID=A0A3P8K2Q5_9TREM|nr:unnamed protein product [Echinostoma caproni]